MQDSQMQSIPIEDIMARPQVVVDYYIRISSGKYILVSRAGVNTPVESLEKYRQKGVNALFVRLADYQRYISMAIQAAESVSGSQAVSSESRISVLQQAVSAVYREFEEIGFSDTIFNHAKLVNHSTMMFVEQSRDLGDLIVTLSQLEDGSVKHAMMVSLVSTMLGYGHGWEKPSTLEHLALGGFLHDIGKTKLPKSIVDKREDRLSRDERIIYQSHTESGRQLLSQSKSVPDDVMLIVVEHHELSDGSGFPRGLKDFQISPLARVVALANAYVNKIADLGAPVSSETALQVAQELRVECPTQFNRDAFKALFTILEKDREQATG